MNIIYTDEFRKRFKKLPINIQRLYRKQESIFKNDWRDSKLHTKKLIKHKLPFSFRITHSYRVLFAFVNNSAVLFATIGHRKNIYK
jgi:mRNA-degrading endonuclease RelE of RelBE toxin-antitoxin system